MAKNGIETNEDILLDVKANLEKSTDEINGLRNSMKKDIEKINDMDSSFLKEDIEGLENLIKEFNEFEQALEDAKSMATMLEENFEELDNDLAR